MITGFNTDVDHADRTFHVQTEDKGLQNPVVESLVYSGGEIITSRRTSYEELAESGGFSEGEVLGRMEAQHQALIRDICNGKFDKETPKPFGHSIITNRTLDEVALEYLMDTIEVGPIEVAPLDPQVLYAGSKPTLHLQVIDTQEHCGLPGVSVVVTLISTRQEPQELFVGETDEDGFCDASFEIPDMPSDDLAICCKATVLKQQAEFRQVVSQARRV